VSAQLVIIGAGGHAKVCYEIAVAMEEWSEIIILDDNPNNDFFEIQGPISSFVNYPHSQFFVAIGSNNVREYFYSMIKSKDFTTATLIHTSAIISRSSTVGEGTVIMPGVIINANSRIGDNVILNTAVTIDHDNLIHNNVHISPGSHLAGNVEVGKGSWIGIGTNVINNLTIGKDIMVGSSSNVINDLREAGIYYGNPAKFVKERQL